MPPKTSNTKKGGSRQPDSWRAGPKVKNVGEVNFNIDKDGYNPFVQEIRQLVRPPPPASPPPPKKRKPNTSSSSSSAEVPPPPTELVDVKLQLATTVKTLTLKMKRGNLYIIGGDNGKMWEFGKYNKPASERLLDGSRWLGFSENYNDMGGLDKVYVGYYAFRNAVEFLIECSEVKGYDVARWKSSLATLTVMIAEPTRYEWLLEDFSILMETKDSIDIRLKPWMKDLIRSWETLSISIRKDDLQKEQENNPAAASIPAAAATDDPTTDDESILSLASTRDVNLLYQYSKLAKACVVILVPLQPAAGSTSNQ